MNYYRIKKCSISDEMIFLSSDQQIFKSWLVHKGKEIDQEDQSYIEEGFLPMTKLKHDFIDKEFYELQMTQELDLDTSLDKSLERAERDKERKYDKIESLSCTYDTQNI